MLPVLMPITASLEPEQVGGVKDEKQGKTVSARLRRSGTAWPLNNNFFCVIA